MSSPRTTTISFSRPSRSDEFQVFRERLFLLGARRSEAGRQSRSIPGRRSRIGRRISSLLHQNGVGKAVEVRELVEHVGGRRCDLAVFDLGKIGVRNARAAFGIAKAQALAL